ncbi:hypothetical protein Landi51_08747 [Colletotrichum acutatum]
MGSLLPTAIRIDASLLNWHHLSSTASFLILSSLLLGILSQVLTRRLKVPTPLSEEVSDILNRKRSYGANARKLLDKYYERFTSKPFGIDTMDGVKVVLPLASVDELKSHPALSFKASIDNANWTPVKPYQQFFELVAILSARIMHSDEAARNPAWTNLSMSFVHTAIDYGSALKQWPPFLRPFVAYFLPERLEKEKQWAQGREIVAKSMARKNALGGASLENPPTMLDHLSSGDHADKAGDLDLQLLLQMTLAVASIHTTSSSMVQVLYDLAAYPEYTEELRQEVVEVLESSGGIFTKQSLAEMKKLDSWMKESLRMNAPDLSKSASSHKNSSPVSYKFEATFQRMATKPVTLKDGTYIPAGTKMELPTSAINFDASIYPDPHKFDGMRSYRQRQKEGMAHKHSFVSVTRTELGWGFGRHACPGRFLSDVEIKLMFAEFLLNYEIKNLDGQPRSKNVEFGVNVLPDPEHQVLIRARKI